MTYRPSLKENIAHDLGEENEDLPDGEWTVILSIIGIIGFGSAVYFVDYVGKFISFIVK